MSEGFMKISQTMALGLASLIFSVLPGCSKMMHEMQPHRLWRWNYHSPNANSDGSYGAYFSVEDSLEQTQKPDSVYARKSQ